MSREVSLPSCGLLRSRVPQVWPSRQMPLGQAPASAGEVVPGSAGSCSPLGPDVLLLTLMVCTLCICFWFSGHRAKCDIKRPSSLLSYKARLRGKEVGSYKGSSSFAPSSHLVFSHQFFHLKFIFESLQVIFSAATGH